MNNMIEYIKKNPKKKRKKFLERKILIHLLKINSI